MTETQKSVLVVLAYIVGIVLFSCAVTVATGFHDAHECHSQGGTFHVNKTEWWCGY